MQVCNLDYVTRTFARNRNIVRKCAGASKIGDISAMGHQIHFMFISRVGIFGSADRSWLGSSQRFPRPLQLDLRGPIGKGLEGTESLADRAILQKDINTLCNWSQTWQMCFNAKKCHILNISRKRQKPCLYYQLGQEALSVVDPIHRRNNIH